LSRTDARSFAAKAGGSSSSPLGLPPHAADVPAIADLLATHHLERGLEWHPVVSVPALAEGTDWSGEFGFVHELLPKKLPRPLPEYEYYFAGPPPMVEATIRLLVADNMVPQAQLHFDRFF
jgi:toluene monooxygenase electron transfer component